MSHLQQKAVSPLPTDWLGLDQNTGHELLGAAFILRVYAVKCHVVSSTYAP